MPCADSSAAPTPSPSRPPTCPLGCTATAQVEHTWPLEQLWEYYGNSLEAGLTDAQVTAARAKYGPNMLTPPATTPMWLKFLLQFADFFSMLLVIGGTLCFIAYGLDQTDPTNLYLGVVLYVVVLITAIFSFFQEAQSAAIMEGFKKLIPKRCRCVRNGSVVEIDATELVPGDIVVLEDGMQIPADIRVITANEMKVDNSSLTGESEPQDRTPELAKDEQGNLITQPLEASNIAFYTTIVSSGNGMGCVIGTGDRTVMGQIAGLATETSNEATPIAREIAAFIKLISAVAIFLGAAVLAICLAFNFDPIKSVVLMIGIIVANVPEGLLVTVTVSLALTAKRMSLKAVLVKHLEAVETLGSTSVIASDKTGTLTQNRMTVQHCWYDYMVKATPAAKNIPDFKAKLAAGGADVYDPKSATYEELFKVAQLCNNARFLFPKPDEEGFQCTEEEFPTKMNAPDFNLLMCPTAGDASESGILKMCQAQEDALEYRAKFPKLFEIKFNSTNKWQLSIHQTGEKTAPLLVMKGAPERVWKRCKYIMIEGKEVPITPEITEKYNEAYEGLGGLGERVLGFAMKSLKSCSNTTKYVQKPSPNFPTEELTFVGLYSLIDPPREGVPEAVAKCKRARIKVFMVTGDHPITAQAIAKQVGIIDQEAWDAGRATVVKGDDIRDWMEIEDPVARQAKWDEALSHEQIVFARVSPAHKLLIVENNQRRGEVVAVTGDGVNDAPALKKGDIGVAMGIAGKDVSKEAADMILMDDNFASIVNGVEEGRLIFDNLKKSICYTLTSNIPEITPFLTFIILAIPLPLSTVLILCVDLGTDMVPAISMAYELKESDIMDRPPRNAETDRLVNRRLITFAYLQIGIMQALAGFFTYMTVLNDYGYTPTILMGNGLPWEERSLMCTIDENGYPHKCGYGCEAPKYDDTIVEEDGAVVSGFYNATFDDKDYAGSYYCKDGCVIPCADGELNCDADAKAMAADPFSEFDDKGYRGEGFCDVYCGNWAEVYPGEPLPEACVSSETISVGFKGRGEQKPQAPAGAKYYWAGKQQNSPNVAYQRNALYNAQTAYFISIIVVQWADLLIAKTRKLSLFEQGLGNGFMNFGLMFETVLGCILIYVPFLNDVFGTRPLHILHWMPGVPWSIMILVYDETRKYLMRGAPGGWIDTMTYW